MNGFGDCLALAVELSRQRDILSRAESFTRQLQAELAEAARCHAIAAVVAFFWVHGGIIWQKGPPGNGSPASRSLTMHSALMRSLSANSLSHGTTFTLR